MSTPQDRLRQFESLPKPQLSPRHLRNARLVADRIEMLKQLPKGLRVAELGVAAGGFSKEIYDILQPKTLTLVDLWQSERYLPGLEKVSSYFCQPIQEGRVNLVQATSLDFLKSCPSGSIDFVYIDTTHRYHDTLNELKESRRVVGPNGLIGGHDYSLGNIVAPAIYGVIQAVAVFCIEEDFCFKYLTCESSGSNSFILQRITP